MEALLVLDVGGTSVKYGVWKNNRLGNCASFETPKTWAAMKARILQLKEQAGKKTCRCSDFFTRSSGYRKGNHLWF
ncbi:hypothetical protein IGI67_003614 [Enterococcus sp. AZ196]